MNKYEKWYNQIVARGIEQKQPGYECHHIIPRSLGGTDDKTNLTIITAREHFICHWLLIKIYPTGEEHWKMINALRMMRAEGPHQQRYNTKITGRVYANIREEHARLQSERVSGDRNGAKKPEARQKVRESKLGKKRDPFTDEWLGNLSSNHKSKKPDFDGTHSEDTKKKIGDRIRGRKQTDEEKERRRIANLGSKRERKSCPHCGKTIAVNGYARFHGDKCKAKIL